MKNDLVFWICFAGIIFGIIWCIGPPVSRKMYLGGLTVDSHNPDAFATLGEAVKSASEGDTIYVAAGHSEIMEGRRFTQEELSSLMAMARERDTLPDQSKEWKALQKKINAILYKSVEGETCIDKPGLTIIGVGKPKPEFVFAGD